MTDRTPRPPLVGRILCRLRPLGARRGEIESDLLELFETRVQERGRVYAAWRYYLDALSLWRVAPTSDRNNAVDVGSSRSRTFAGVGQDIVFAMRLFRREPGLFALTIAGVALAIAITTSVFSVVDALAFRGPGVPDPASILRFTIARGPGPGAPWPYADYLRLRDSSQSFEAAAALAPGYGSLDLGDAGTGEDQKIRYVPVGVVSGNFFAVMGGRAALGRTLTVADDQAGAAPAVVITDRFWRSEFGADPSVLGRTIRLRRELFTIVGIAARGFSGPTQFEDTPACWMSLTTFAELQERQPGSAFNRRFQNVDVFGRLGPHISRSNATSVATSVAVAAAVERGLTDREIRPKVDLASLAERPADAFLMLAVTVVLAIVGLIVVLAAVNVANLLLASAAGRRREIGVRLTLGASRLRIVRQLITESLLLGVAGGAAGVALALWTTPLLARLLRLPEMLDVSPGARVLGFSLLVTIGVGLVAGLAPARFGRRGELLSSINAETPTATGRSTGRLRSVLVGTQAAASIVLLVLAALLTRALIEAVRLDLGLQAGHLIRVNPDFRSSDTDTSRRAYLEAVQERLRHTPGVASTSLALMTPFESGYAPMRAGNQTRPTVGGYLRGEAAGVEVLRNETSADYFDTIGARIIRGRSYTADEVRTTAAVVVISESLARQFWPGEDPIGSRLTRVWGEEIPANGRPMGFLRKPVGTRVIGVVSESITRLRSYDSPALYLPLDPLNTGGARLLVRTTGDPHGSTRAIRDALKSTDAAVDIQMSFVSEGVDEQLRYPKTFALIAGIFGVSTLALAVLGLFGVTTFVVRQRQREVSVRLALGASGADVVRLLLRDSLRPVLIGLACGLFVALLGGYVIRGMLYGVSGHDPMAVVSAVLVLLIAATAAVLGPARRALRIDPAESLKRS